MRPFRSRLLLRTVATLLVVGVASTLAPTAVACDTRADALRSLLDDDKAFETALRAAHKAGEGAVARDAFVYAYVEAAEEEVAVEAIYQLLDGPSLGLVAPIVPDAAFVPSPTATPSGSGGTAATLASDAQIALPTAALSAWLGASTPVHLVEGRSLQPRAP